MRSLRILLGLLLAAAALLPRGAGALEVPQLDRHVIDRAEVLSVQTRQRLEQSLARFERDASHQIVVHTTPSLEGLAIEDYSLEIAEEWKVGHKGLDNGVILTIAPSERKVRIEVGYGLEGTIPDAIASRIIREAILPAFQRGDLEGGIVAGIALLQSAASGEVIPASQRPRAPRAARGRSSGFPIWVWLGVFAMFGFRGIFFLPFLGGLGGRGGGFGGGGFGGGFSGGGGGFGGGGASGSW